MRPSPPPETAASSAGPVLELEGLAVRLGKLDVLKGLDVSLSGRCIGLLGPNGAGKTTLLHTLLGFYPPRAGTARVLGHDVRREIMAVRSLLGYMPERDSFIADATAVRYVRLMAELSGLPAREALERAHEALFYVGLGEARYRPMASYSLGMKQLAKLAQALAHGPRLLLLDEPTAGLDPPARNRMLQLIQEIRDAGQVRVLLSSHLLRDVDECCDSVLVLKDGQVAGVVDLEAERRSNRRLLNLELHGEGREAFTAGARELGCEVAAGAGGRLHLVLPQGVEVASLYRLADQHRIQMRRLSYREDSLEDIFRKAMDGTLLPGGQTPGAAPSGASAPPSVPASAPPPAAPPPSAASSSPTTTDSEVSHGGL